jgi:hypothetical protein
MGRPRKEERAGFLGMQPARVRCLGTLRETWDRNCGVENLSSERLEEKDPRNAIDVIGYIQ